jgi:hypothetical protein
LGITAEDLRTSRMRVAKHLLLYQGKHWHTHTQVRAYTHTHTHTHTHTIYKILQQLINLL